MKMLKVGLVGCGGMGNEHLKIVAQVPNTQLVGVCDHRPDRANRMGVQHHVPAWIDYVRFIEDVDLDVIHICSPSGLHGRQGILAAERGIHVLCEKPLDINLAMVDRLIGACDENGVLLGSVFQRRMSRGAQIVQAAIAQGGMGRLLSCSASIKWSRTQGYYDKDDWRGTWRFDGGAFANQGIHTLDQMVWMAGPAEEVEYAHFETVGHTMEAEDLGFAVVRFANGARGTIEVTTCCLPDLSTRLEIYGLNGSAALDDARVVRFGLNGKDMMPLLEDAGGLSGGGTDPWSLSLTGHEEQISDFYEAIREKRAPMVAGRDARPAVALLSMLYAKAFPGRQIGWDGTD